MKGTGGLRRLPRFKMGRNASVWQVVVEVFVVVGKGRSLLYFFPPFRWWWCTIRFVVAENMGTTMLGWRWQKRLPPQNKNHKGGIFLLNFFPPSLLHLSCHVGLCLWPSPQSDGERQLLPSRIPFTVRSRLLHILRSRWDEQFENDRQLVYFLHRLSQ